MHLYVCSVALDPLSYTPGESAERASSTPHEKVRACRESELGGGELVCLVQTQSALCVSVNNSVRLLRKTQHWPQMGSPCLLPLTNTVTTACMCCESILRT